MEVCFVQIDQKDQLVAINKQFPSPSLCPVCTFHPWSSRPSLCPICFRACVRPCAREAEPVSDLGPSLCPTLCRKPEPVPEGVEDVVIIFIQPNCKKYSYPSYNVVYEHEQTEHDYTS